MKKTNPQNRVTFTDQMVLFAMGIALVYWLLMALMAVFSGQGSIVDRLLGEGLEEIGTRVIVLCMFVIFGAHAQYTINERKTIHQKLERDRLTRERFQRLLSPDLAELVVSGLLQVEKGGEDRTATVLFVDIRGFTAMSENTPAAAVLAMLNEYYEILVEIVFRNEGTVDKFIGDAMMVIWGAPIRHDDDPVRAARTALEIQAALKDFNAMRYAEGKYPIEAGIGINTGSLMAGYIGSSRTMSYSVIGDTVNTASRLCDAAKAGQVLVTDATHAHLTSRFSFRELPPLETKGMHRPLRIYQVLAETCAEDADGTDARSTFSAGR